MSCGRVITVNIKQDCLGINDGMKDVVNLSPIRLCPNLTLFDFYVLTVTHLSCIGVQTRTEILVMVNEHYCRLNFKSTITLRLYGIYAVRPSMLYGTFANPKVPNQTIRLVTNKPDTNQPHVTQPGTYRLPCAYSNNEQLGATDFSSTSCITRLLLLLLDVYVHSRCNIGCTPYLWNGLKTQMSCAI